MTQLTTDAAIKRFGENEERVDKFVNTDDPYFTNEPTPREVESLPHLMARLKERYLTAVYRGAWTTSTSYAINDGVKQDGIVYLCAEAHTAGTFATDLAAGKWGIAQGVTPTELASSAGGDMVSVKPKGAQSRVRSLTSIKGDLPNLLDWDFDPNGNNDSTSAMRKMIADSITSGFRRVFGAEGTFVLTEQIDVNSSIWIDGVGVEPYSVISLTGENTRGRGTWFHLAHNGKGFNIARATGNFSGVKFSGIGTFRDQTIPSSGTFTPVSQDFDFYTDNCADTDFEDIVLLNAFRGICCTNGGAGRLNVRNVRGQPLYEGIVIDEAYDICRLTDVHLWPFWSHKQSVWDWMIANANGITSVRNDNPFFTNLFTIFYNNGLVIKGGPNGTTNKLKLVNGDFDRGFRGVLIDGTADNHAGKYINVSSQGETGVSGNNQGFVCYADNCDITISNPDFRIFNSNAIRIEGTGNDVKLHNPQIESWNLSASSWPAVEAVSGNVIRITGDTHFDGGNGAALIGGTGNFDADIWRPYTPRVAAQIGAISNVGAISGSYKLAGRTCYFSADIVITNIGTASGSIYIGLPFVSANAEKGISGREINVGGKTLGGMIEPSQNYADVYNYDNTFPAVNNCRLIISGMFEVNA